MSGPTFWRDDVVNGDEIARLLADVPFPATRNEIIELVGRRPVRYVKWQTSSLGELLMQIEDRRYASARDVVDALST